MSNERNDGFTSPLIPKNKIKPFEVLFDRIKKKIGNYESARHKIGLGSDTMSDLHSGKRLSVAVGRRIVNTYNEVCNG